MHFAAQRPKENETRGLWTAAASAVASAYLGYTIPLVIFVVCCQTSHALREDALQRLGYLPPSPFRFDLFAPVRRWRERNTVAHVKSQLDAIVARRNQSLQRDQTPASRPTDDSPPTS